MAIGDKIVASGHPRLAKPLVHVASTLLSLLAFAASIAVGVGINSLVKTPVDPGIAVVLIIVYFGVTGFLSLALGIWFDIHNAPYPDPA